jgi:hypothetical protein
VVTLFPWFLREEKSCFSVFQKVIGSGSLHSFTPRIWRMSLELLVVPKCQ